MQFVRRYGAQLPWCMLSDTAGAMVHFGIRKNELQFGGAISEKISPLISQMSQGSVEPLLTLSASNQSVGFQRKSWQDTATTT